MDTIETLVTSLDRYADRGTPRGAAAVLAPEPWVRKTTPGRELRTQGRRRRALGVAAAALALGGIAGVGVLRSDGGDDGAIDLAVTPGTGGPATTAATTAVDPGTCPDGRAMLRRPDEVMVYLHPGVDVAAVATVRQRLAAAPELSRVVFVDQDAAYAEFRHLFADQPDLLDSVTADELPASFRFPAEESRVGALLEELAALPGVKTIVTPWDLVDPTAFACGPATSEVARLPPVSVPHDVPAP